MHKILWFFILSFNLVYAKTIIDCRVVISGISECNPYGEKYLYTQEITYDKDRKKLITVKSLPVPDKEPALKVVSVSELVEKYVKDEAALEEITLGSKDGKKPYSYLKTIFFAKKTQSIKEPSLMYGKYTIVQGDALSRIARRFNISTNRITSLNNLKKGSVLTIGQKLTIPLTQKKIDELSAISLKKAEKKYVTYGNRRLRVTATAYTSSPKETDSTPFLAAWNNRLVPGMKSIAVSRDMLSVYGMRNGTSVRISGLPGVYKVKDKMNKRYRKRIDIYMGLDRPKALRWGKRSVVIHW